MLVRAEAPVGVTAPLVLGETDREHFTRCAVKATFGLAAESCTVVDDMVACLVDESVVTAVWSTNHATLHLAMDALPNPRVLGSVVVRDAATAAVQFGNGERGSCEVELTDAHVFQVRYIKTREGK